MAFKHYEVMDGFFKDAQTAAANIQGTEPRYLLV